MYLAPRYFVHTKIDVGVDGPKQLNRGVVDDFKQQDDHGVFDEDEVKWKPVA